MIHTEKLHRPLLSRVGLALAAAAALLAFSASASEASYLRLTTEIKVGGKVVASPMLLVRPGSRSAVSATPAGGDVTRVGLAVDETSASAGQVSLTATVSVESDGGKAKREESFKFKAALDKPVAMASKSGGDAISLTVKASRASAEQLKALGVK